MTMNESFSVSTTSNYQFWFSVFIIHNSVTEDSDFKTERHQFDPTATDAEILTALKADTRKGVKPKSCLLNCYSPVGIWRKSFCPFFSQMYGSDKVNRNTLHHHHS